MTFNATNQITNSGYTYDAAGNMTNDSFHSYTYDAEGNILTVDNGATAQYVYDALNRRIRAQTSASTYEYLYDYAGRRVSSWLNPTSGNTGTGVEGRIYWDGQQIAYRAQDGTTYFEQQNYLSTERLRTNYQGTVEATFTSLPWGDGSSTTVGGTGAEQDNYFFAGLDADTTGSGAQMSDHAQFRNYSFTQGRWLAPDPYDGSYDLTNPQSFNRYAYVLNNPLTFTDPSGQAVLPVIPPTVCAAGPEVCAIGIGVDIAEIVIVDGIIHGLEDLFKPKFHGTLAPRPGSGTPDWGDDPGSFGESLGIGSNLKTGSWGIAGALGLPDAGCEFGACGAGPMSAVNGSNPNNSNATITFPDGYYVCGDFICAPGGRQVSPASRQVMGMHDSSGLIFMGAGGVVGAADIAAGESGVLFGTVRNGLEGGGLFNRGDYLRVGWSALRSGGARFRLGGDLIEDIFGTRHINLWPPSWWFGPPPGR